MTTPPAPPDTWSMRGLARALAVACVALLAGAGTGYRLTHERPPDPRGDDRRGAASATTIVSAATVVDHQPASPPRAAPAGDAELALVAPLRQGGRRGDYVVAEIDGVDARGLVHVEAHRGVAVVKLVVALRADDGPSPPAVAGRYAVFYSTEGTSTNDAEQLARALAVILEANAAKPAPPGMKPFLVHDDGDRPR